MRKATSDCGATTVHLTSLRRVVLRVKKKGHRGTTLLSMEPGADAAAVASPRGRLMMVVPLMVTTTPGSRWMMLVSWRKSRTFDTCWEE